MRNFQISPPSEALLDAINHQIDTKTKPLGALGRLESVARKVALIQNSLIPVLKHPHLLVFAADHGAALDGVSAYPQEVTFQMVMNFLQGGAAINVFSRQHGINLKVVDAGVNYDFEPNDLLIDAKIAQGTKSFISERAMTETQCVAAMEKGAQLVEEKWASVILPRPACSCMLSLALPCQIVPAGVPVWTMKVSTAN